MGKILMRVLIAAALVSALLSCDFGSGAPYPEVDTFVKDYYTTDYNSYPVAMDMGDSRVLMGGHPVPL